MTNRMKVEELDTEGSPDGHTPQVLGNRLVLAAPPAGGGGSGLTVQDENGNVATDVTQIDFQGAGVTAAAGAGEVVVTVSGGGSGAGGSTLLLENGASVPAGTAVGTLVWEKTKIGLPSVISSMGASAYWRQGDAAGSSVMADSSGNQRHGTYVNSPGLGVPGLLVGDADLAVDYDGTNDHASVPYSATWMNPADFTLFAVIKPDVAGGASANTILSRRDGSGLSNQSWQWRINTAGKLELLVMSGNAAYTCTGATTLAAGTKYVVAARKTGSAYTMFVEGASNGTASIGAPNSTPSGMIVGASLGGGATPSEYFNGVIDEVAFIPSGLSDADVAALTTAAKTAPTTTGLLAATFRGWWAG